MKPETDRRSLFAVVFEVRPDPAHKEDYLHIAGALRPELEKVTGFLENERFASQSRKGVLLSLSLWDDEKALVRWRTVAMHARAQEQGRAVVLADYHLRVGEVTRVTGPFADRPVGWMRHDETDVGEARALSLVDAAPGAGSLASATDAGWLHAETFEHLHDIGRTVTLMSWRGIGEAEAFAARAAGDGVRTYAIRVIRDYGMNDRREAPQYR
ncbi:MAG TPA: antibiotic biosynthesis monooxygenase [Luteibacter sp.]|jgi:heme-degrading monooxygenase HmoA|nr:antibiotic biosynthesis monooxygenase [Luteibacter sp.]